MLYFFLWYSLAVLVRNVHGDYACDSSSTYYSSDLLDPYFQIKTLIYVDEDTLASSFNNSLDIFIDQFADSIGRTNVVLKDLFHLEIQIDDTQIIEGVRCGTSNPSVTLKNYISYSDSLKDSYGLVYWFSTCDNDEDVVMSKDVGSLVCESDGDNTIASFNHSYNTEELDPVLTYAIARALGATDPYGTEELEIITDTNDTDTIFADDAKSEICSFKSSLLINRRCNDFQMLLPASTEDSVCGNGYVEAGEECECLSGAMSCSEADTPVSCESCMLVGGELNCATSFKMKLYGDTNVFGTKAEQECCQYGNLLSADTGCQASGYCVNGVCRDLCAEADTFTNCGIINSGCRQECMDAEEMSCSAYYSVNRVDISALPVDVKCLTTSGEIGTCSENHTCERSEVYPTDVSFSPTMVPTTGAPTDVPTDAPTDVPTDVPTNFPTLRPTFEGETWAPTGAPTSTSSTSSSTFDTKFYVSVGAAGGLFVMLTVVLSYNYWSSTATRAQVVPGSFIEM